MKTHTCIHHVLRIVALLTLAIGIQTAHAQGTAFTYQGLLSSSNAPFSGSAEFQFVLWDSASGGNAVATNNPASLIATVTGGLFTVTLDFGVNPFDGSPRFLETGVRTAIGPFTTLTPRQPLTATPYALRASNLTSNGLAGAYGNAVTFSNAGNSFAGTFTGTVSGDGSGLANVNAATVGGLSATGFWQTDGNAGANPTNGAFIGTTDNLPLEFRVNGTRVLRLEPTGASQPPNVIGGISLNVVDHGVVGSTISGGGTIPGIGSGPNHISENLATIGGGTQNTNAGRFGTIGGGGNNNINLDTFSFATIAGGDGNKIQSGAEFSTIGGGGGNNIGLNSANSTISGGALNTISSNSVENVIGGGNENSVTAGNADATIGGGTRNTIFTDGGTSVIGGGSDNVIGATPTGGTTPFAGGNIIGGGVANNIRTNADFGTISGGEQNIIGTNSDLVTIAGGGFNSVSTTSSASVISGGSGNSIGANSIESVIGGGNGNSVAAGTTAATIGGGNGNSILPDGGNSIIGGGSQNLIGGTPGSLTTFVVGYNTISGGVENNIRTNAGFGTISGGEDNVIGTNADFVTIAGGVFNLVSTSSSKSVISGGDNNNIGTNSTDSVIGGGSGNIVANNASFAIVPGGDSNGATNYGFAAGRRAKANHIGAFVWGDSNNADVVSTNANSVTMRAQGGYRLFSTNGTTAGVSLAPGGTAWAVISDRNVKKDFTAVDSRAILEKLAVMPITQWHYQWEETAVTPHIGPMAQDFKAAFYPGTDDKSITTQEADGVELAAIQGLNQKLEEKDAKIHELEHRLDALENILARQK